MSKSTYKTEIRIWSEIGHTPITGRPGEYCDELVHMTVWLPGHDAAADFVRNMLDLVPHAVTGHFAITNYPNQNLQSDWIGLSHRRGLKPVTRELVEALQACLLRLDEHDEQSAPEALQARKALRKVTVRGAVRASTLAEVERSETGWMRCSKCGCSGPPSKI